MNPFPIALKNPRDFTCAEFYDGGRLKRCLLLSRCPLSYSGAELIPFYREDGIRRKFSKSLTFFENGNLESVILQDAAVFQTSVGEIPAEMATFYPNGSVRRLFPVFSSIGTFWTEKDEREISPEISLELPFGRLRKKAINIMFYDTGEFKSMTLWPGDTVPLAAGPEIVPARIGFSLYRGGGLHSLEPCAGASVDTPVGRLPVFDPDALGADGDRNSLVFEPDGRVSSLVTASARLRLLTPRGERLYSPRAARSRFLENRLAVEPLRVVFYGGSVRIGVKSGPGEIYPIGAVSAAEPFDSSRFVNGCEDCLYCL